MGYFGAAGGILLLVVLTAMVTEPLARTNALKNVVSGLANMVAAVAFALFGPVRWAAVLPLAAGFLIGGRIGPMLVRYMPARVLRVVIGLGGIGPRRQARPLRLRLTSDFPQRKPSRVISPGGSRCGDFGFYSGASQRTPSGGRVSTADAGCPCHGSGTASITPRFPTPLPP